MMRGFRFQPSHGVILALVLITLIAGWRYQESYFLSVYNIQSVLRYNSMFALVALGMCFVIMTGGIDLSVGSVAALASVVSAYLSPYGLVPGVLGGLGAGLAAGLVNSVVITKLKIMPFIATHHPVPTRRSRPDATPGDGGARAVASCARHRRHR